MEIRAITDDEVPAFRACLLTTFGEDGDGDPDGDRRFRALIAPGQAWAAFDRGTIVGTAGTLELELGMPGGGTLAMAGLTMVTVRPTHRRRGILRTLMQLHLDDARERGRAISGLWASEATIYGRFGYAPAVWDWVIEVTGARELEVAGGGDEIEWLEPARAREVLPEVYARATAQRPGVLRRSATWWRERRFQEQGFVRRGASQRRHVLAVRSGAAVGYLAFRQRVGQGYPVGRLEIIELVGVDPRAIASLWKFALAVDLFPTVAWPHMPIDDPLVHLVSDPRAVSRKHSDSLWLRIEDVAAVLAARRFEGCAVTVGDRTYGNGPAVEVAPRVLPALVMGGARATELAQAGLLRGDVMAAERAFATPIAPWCPEVF
jgi:predicted N-acetyltransferase YhbS